LQKVVRGFKEAKGVHADNADWDRKFFARHTKPAKELLTAFDGDPDRAIAYILAKSVEWEDLPDWGLEAIVKAAARDYTRIGGERADQHGEMGAAGDDGPRGRGSTTRAREVARDALRAIEATAVRAAESALEVRGPDRGRDAASRPELLAGGNGPDGAGEVNRAVRAGNLPDLGEHQDEAQDGGGEYEPD